LASIGEPAGAVMAGMLLNETKEIPPDLNVLFSNLGLTHIVAISGSHIVVVMSIISAILMWLGISRPRAFWPSVVAVVFYVLLVGSPASAVRSAIMAIVVMYATKIGRLSSVGNALLLSAVLMILVNPKILLFDVGFQLSFVSVCGLAYVGPRLAEKLKNLPELGPIKEIVVATFSAQIMVWPLTIFYFGNFSIVSLLANVLILPMVPLMMTWGIVNLAISAIWLQAGIWLGLVSYFLVGYWISVAELLAKIPGAYWKIGNFVKILGFLIYFVLAWFFLRAKRDILKK
jgi:competence protein ComEC